MKLEKSTILKDYNRWLKAYMRHAKHREVSKNSILIYNRVLGKLGEYIEEQDEAEKLSDIDREFFFDFMEWFEESSSKGSFATKTKTLYISVLKSFFVYISDNNDEFYTYEKEFKDIMPKKANKSKKIKYLSDDEVSKLLKFLEESLKNKKHYAYIHSLGIKLMLYAGLRISEVLSLELDDITISDLTDEDGNRDFYEIYLKDTKSKEEQIAIIPIKYIQKELEYFKTINNKYIFQGKGSKNSIDRSNFYLSVSKILESLNIKNRGLHIFRHTCAMQLYRKTGNLLVLKETLRHSDIKTTMIYAHAEKRDIAKAMR
ncbi:MAG TPA: site-specific integrase [Campylobacterales bacterium]|nr:site-specific integrase [Campylobacterales bacterium]